MVKNYRDTIQALLIYREAALPIREHSIRLRANMYKSEIIKAQSSSLSHSIVRMRIAQRFKKFNLGQVGLKVTSNCLKTSLSCKTCYKVRENVKFTKMSTVKSEQ